MKHNHLFLFFPLLLALLFTSCGNGLSGMEEYGGEKDLDTMKT